MSYFKLARDEMDQRLLAMPLVQFVLGVGCVVSGCCLVLGGVALVVVVGVRVFICF